MRISLLVLLVPLSCVAADLGPSIEDQLRDLRSQIKLQDVRRTVDAIRAREQAARDWNQRQIENAFLLDDLRRHPPQRYFW